MEILNVDYIKLDASLDRLSQLSLSLSQEIGRIAEYTTNLDIFWDGDANSAYIAKIGEDLIEIDTIMMRIRSVVKTAVKALDLYQKNEKEIKKMIGDYMP